MVASQAETLRSIQQLVEKDDLAKARTQLSQLLKASPKDPVLLNLLGVVDGKEGKYGAAESNFRKAILAAPDFAGAYLNLGRLYQENAGKDPEALKKALATYKRLLRFEPANVDANYQTALLLWRLGSFQASLGHVLRLPREVQERPQALAIQCADYAGLKNLRRAQSEAERLLGHPDLAEADILTLLPVLVAQRHHDLALKLLEGLEVRQLASPNTLHELALLYERGARLDQARATLEKVASQQPSPNVLTLTELARIANHQGDHEGALGYLAHARDLDPNNAGIHFFFGMVCVEMDLAQEAYASLQKAVRLNPNDPYYNYALGAVITTRSSVREAYPYLKKYCELKPDDPRGRLALGAAYFYGHDPELALKELNSVLKFRETAVAAHYFLGRLANQEGRYDAAIGELNQAIQLNPRYADAYAELGLLHLKQKQYVEAESALRKALDFDADDYTANLNLMILYQRTKDPRAEAQAKRFDELKKMRAEREKEFLRTIEIRPF